MECKINLQCLSKYAGLLSSSPGVSVRTNSSLSVSVRTISRLGVSVRTNLVMRVDANYIRCICSHDFGIQG